MKNNSEMETVYKSVSLSLFCDKFFYDNIAMKVIYFTFSRYVGFQKYCSIQYNSNNIYIFTIL